MLLLYRENGGASSAGRAEAMRLGTEPSSRYETLVSFYVPVECSLHVAIALVARYSMLFGQRYPSRYAEFTLLSLSVLPQSLDPMVLDLAGRVRDVTTLPQQVEGFA